VIIEVKTPVRQAISWVDAAEDIHKDYESRIPEAFVCNVFSVATEGKEGSVPDMDFIPKPQIHIG
jgi:type I restriction enzyme R subunit